MSDHVVARAGQLLTPEVVLLLEKRLQNVTSVTRFDRAGEPQATTLAHSLADLEESFREVLENLLPRLVDSNLDSGQLNDVLLDIGEELRHIHYHIRDPKFFDYLL
jgi:hypothetical protein